MTARPMSWPTSHDDPVREELLGAIRALNEDERIRLVALAWLGRGTYELGGMARGGGHRAQRTFAAAPPNICSACRCWAIIWKTAWRCSTTASWTMPTRAKAWTSEDEPLGNMPDKPRTVTASDFDLARQIERAGPLQDRRARRHRCR